MTRLHRALLLSLALGVAILGQAAFLHPALATWPVERRLTVGVLLLAAAMLLFGLGSGSALLPPPPPAESKRWFGQRPWLFALAVAVYLLALALYLTRPEGWLVRGLWLLGMILLLAAYSPRLHWPRPRRADGRDLLLLAVITGIGFFLRYWQLPELPSYVHGDIASQGLQAVDVLRRPDLSWFSVGWSNIPMFDFVMMAGTMKLFGADLFGLSLTAVWQGVLTLPAIYLLGRELFDRRAGLLAAALLSLSYTHIHFSRIVTTASPLLFIILTFFALFRGLRTGRSFWYAAAGLGLGLGLLVYYPIRISVLMALALFFWLLIWQRQSIMQRLDRWLAFAVASLIGFGPMMGFVFKDFSGFVGRGALVTLANPEVMQHLTGKYGATTPSQVWLEQVKRTFLTFFYYPDASTHFGFPGPLVSAFAAILFALGCALALQRLRDARYMTLLAWVLTTLILGGVLTNDPPFWPHIIIVLPAVFLLAAAAAVRLWDAWLAALPAVRRRAGNLTLAGIAILTLALTGARDWRVYAQHVADNAESVMRAARLIASQPADVAFLITPDPFDWESREIQFMGLGRAGRSLTPAEVAGAALPLLDRPTFFIVTPNHADLIPALSAQFPGGEIVEHKASTGWLAFTTYRATPANYTAPPDVVAPGVSLAARQRAGWVIAGIVFLLALAAGLWGFRRGRAAPPDDRIESALTETSGERASLPLVPTSPPTSPSSAHSIAAGVLSEVAAGAVRWWRVLGLLFSLLLAALGQRFFDRNFSDPITQALVRWFTLDTSYEGTLRPGVLFYLAAMLLFALLAPALPQIVAALAPVRRPSPVGPTRQAPDARIVRPSPPANPQATPTTSLHTTPPGALPAFARGQVLLLLAALAPALIAIFLFSQRGEDALVRWLWLAGLLIFVLGQIIWPARRAAYTEPSLPFQRRHLLLLAVILAAAFWLRFNRLDAIPHDFHGDMASIGLQAREILNGQQRDIFREGWANIPMLDFVPAAITLKLFGNNLFGLNMSAVIGGMLSVLGLYLLTWRLFDRHRPALLATAILAINIPHIHFSRLASYMDPWPFLLFTAYFLVDGFKARRFASFAAAGVMLGLGVQMYYSGRVIAVILAVAMVYMLIWRRDWLRQNLLGLGLMVIGIVITLGPSLIYFAENREPLIERSRAVFLYYEPVMTHLKNKYSVATEREVLLEQTRLSLLMFNRSIDSSTQFGYPHPMFSSLISPLVLLGIAFSLRRWRHPGAALNLIWLGVIVVNGSIFTGDAPFWPRLVGILPSAALMAALTIDRVWEAVSSWLGRRQVSLWIAAGVALYLAFAGWKDWQTYFSAVQNNARPQALIGRFISGLPLDVTACGFIDPYALDVRETAFLAWPHQTLDLPADAPDGLIETCPGPPFVWILYPRHIDRLSALQARWPGGEVAEHIDSSGGLVFTSYLVRTGQPATLPAPAPTIPGQITPPTGFAAFNPDGSPFEPQFSFLGNTSSSIWNIPAGRVTVTGGRFTLHVGPLPGHNAVYDFVQLRDLAGAVYRFEAEDLTVTTGDAFSTIEGVDNHWWLQPYASFSSGQGLVVEKQELAPVLTTSAPLPDGVYDVLIGSFSGDPDNGVFGIGIRWE